jgi:hypothetical protein
VSAPGCWAGCWLLACWTAAGAADYPQAPQTTPPEGAPHEVTLAAAEQTRLGVVVGTLAVTAAPAGTLTTARVLDPGPLLALHSELSAALASLAASRAEAERTRKLFAEDRTASERAVEAAAAQAMADQERVDSGRRRIALEWGDGIANLSTAQRSALLNEVAAARAGLVRVELPVGADAPPARATIDVQLGADSPVLHATVLGTLPTADARLQTWGVLAELRGRDAAVPIGRMLIARLPAAGPANGVVLPRSALLRKDSRIWAYVQTAPTRFVRREVTGYEPMSGGWLVHKGFSPGERVVTGGAAALLAIEAPAVAAD